MCFYILLLVQFHYTTGFKEMIKKQADINVDIIEKPHYNGVHFKKNNLIHFRFTRTEAE